MHPHRLIESYTTYEAPSSYYALAPIQQQQYGDEYPRHSSHQHHIQAWNPPAYLPSQPQYESTSPSLYQSQVWHPPASSHLQSPQSSATSPLQFPALHHRTTTGLNNTLPLHSMLPITTNSLHHPIAYTSAAHHPSAAEMTASLASPISQAESDRSYGILSTSSISNSVGPSPTASPTARPASPGTAELEAFGYLNADGLWSCAFPGCTSRVTFTRGCDLRKHHKRHLKSYFCRYAGCSQSTGGGFSSKKDLHRHEAKHKPEVVCEWEGCTRVFSRVDNMRDHVKRIHMKGKSTGADKIY